MFKEIGGSFWLEPKQLEKQPYNELDLHYIVDNEYVAYTSSGRGAISLLIKNICLTKRRVLIPLYTCESIILPFIKNDFSVFFYEINLDLTVNPNSFKECVNKYQPDIVFLQSYFGFETLSEMRSEYHWLRENGIIIIEDITHSLFSKSVKSGADYYVASLRKWLALPDGGLAISTHGELKAESSGIHDIIVNQNIKAFLMKYEYTLNLNKRLKDEFRRIFMESQNILKTDWNYYPMSNISKAILSQTDLNNISLIRRSNYEFLYNHLKSSFWSEPVLGDLPENIVPLYMPVYMKCDREDFQKYLAEREIYATIHWPLPEYCISSQTSFSNIIYKSILSIPCDQRYNNKDLYRIIEAFFEYKG